MADDALITLEHDDGSDVQLPAELTADAPPAADPPPAAAAAPAETPAPEAAAAPETPPAAEDDVQQAEAALATETDPAKRGILGELIKLRKERKAEKQIVTASRQLVAKLQARPDLVRALDEGLPIAPVATPPPAAAPAPTAAPPVPEGPPADELKALAEELGLYDATNRPDLEAARRVYDRTERISTRVAERILGQRVAPIEQTLTRQAADVRRTEALATAKQLGVDDGIAANVIDTLYANDPTLLTNQQAVTTALLFAAGVHAVQQRAGGAPPAPVTPPAAPQQPPAPPIPTFTETPGGRAPAPALSPIEKRLAKQAGVSEDAWLKSTAALSAPTPARFFPMEDE